RAQHRGVDSLPGGANHEHVAQALVEDEFGGHSAVRATEYDRGGLLSGGQAGAVVDALAGMLGLAGDESLVTLFECFPCCYRAGVGHGEYHAAHTHERLAERTHRVVWPIAP